MYTWYDLEKDLTQIYTSGAPGFVSNLSAMNNYVQNIYREDYTFVPDEFFHVEKLFMQKGKWKRIGNSYKWLDKNK